MNRENPYDGLHEDKWEQRTRELVEAHPLSQDELVSVVLEAWDGVLKTEIAGKYKIGKDIFPKPQILGFFLHELIPLKLKERYPGKWRGDETASEKDVVYIPDNFYSFEVKTSSHKNKIFGNRSYAQEGAKESKEKKDKSGFYLAVNFEAVKLGVKKNPRIVLIRFGWLAKKDWLGQIAATGQQARLPPAADKGKLLKLYSPG
jgi:hypothetical protein